MSTLSHKNKIIVAGCCFVIVTAVLVSYIFPLFDKTNAALAGKTLDARKEQAELEAEQRNFELGKRDLTNLAQKPFQPDNFFSNDTSLVKEIKILEDAAKNLSIDLATTVTGTVGSAPKAKTTTDIRMVPTTVQAIGSYVALMQFMQTLEHLSFIMNVKTITISPTDVSDRVSLSLTGNFYVKK